jgi:hypothetical protein
MRVKCGFAEKRSQKASSTVIQVIRPGVIGRPDVDPQQLQPVQGQGGWVSCITLCESYLQE